MKHLFLLFTLVCTIAPALMAMEKSYIPDEVAWIDLMRAAYHNNSATDIAELARQQPNFVKSERIDIFHHLLALSNLPSCARHLALLLNHGAPIVTNTSEKNRTAEHELLTKIILLAKNPARFKDAEEEARTLDACKIVGIALSKAQQLRALQEDTELNHLFRVNPAVATREASYEARSQMLQSDLQRMQEQAMKNKTE